MLFWKIKIVSNEYVYIVLKEEGLICKHGYRLCHDCMHLRKKNNVHGINFIEKKEDRFVL